MQRRQRSVSSHEQGGVGGGSALSAGDDTAGTGRYPLCLFTAPNGGWKDIVGLPRCRRSQPGIFKEGKLRCVMACSFKHDQGTDDQRPSKTRPRLSASLGERGGECNGGGTDGRAVFTAKCFPFFHGHHCGIASSVSGWRQGYSKSLRRERRSATPFQGFGPRHSSQACQR